MSHAVKDLERGGAHGVESHLRHCGFQDVVLRAPKESSRHSERRELVGLPPTVVGADAQRPGHRAKSAAQNALVDHAIGRVVDALDGEGLTDDTLVIVTTDQGNPYGQRGLWEHPQWSDPPFVHDVTFRVPLIVRRPGAVPARRVVDRVVSHYDLFPTMLDYATTAAELRARLESFFAQHVDARYDLWKGGTGQAMVSRYLLFKERYGPDWNVTMEVGPQFAR